MLVASLVPLQLRHFVKAPRSGGEECKPKGADIKQDVAAAFQQSLGKEEVELYTQRVKMYKLRGNHREELGVGVAKFVACMATGRARFTASNEVTGFVWRTILWCRIRRAAARSLVYIMHYARCGALGMWRAWPGE